jgi:hypothetical protein
MQVGRECSLRKEALSGQSCQARVTSSPYSTSKLNDQPLEDLDPSNLALPLGISQLLL